MSIQCVIFDLDGTLIDTEPSAARAIDESMKSWGVNVTAQDAQFITGRTWAMAFQYLTSKYQLPVDPKTAEQTIMQAYRDGLRQGLVEVPGAREAVRSIAEEYPVALVSGSMRSEIEFALKTLGIIDHFEFYLGAEDYPRSKPAPDGYLKALSSLGIPAGRTLVFEDSEPGIASALAAGTRVVAITSTNHFGQNQKGAEVSVVDLAQVSAQWVKQTFAGG